MFFGDGSRRWPKYATTLGPGKIFEEKSWSTVAWVTMSSKPVGGSLKLVSKAIKDGPLFLVGEGLLPFLCFEFVVSLV